MSELTRSLDELPEDERRDIVEGLMTIGKKLREWRDFGGFASITARYETGERTMVEVTCGDGDRLWLLDPPGSEPVEITALMP